VDAAVLAGDRWLRHIEHQSNRVPHVRLEGG
jgi:hypothetical protein